LNKNLIKVDFFSSKMALGVIATYGPWLIAHGVGNATFANYPQIVGVVRHAAKLVVKRKQPEKIALQ
jgi:hypothetical protein